MFSCVLRIRLHNKCVIPKWNTHWRYSQLMPLFPAMEVDTALQAVMLNGVCAITFLMDGGLELNYKSQSSRTTISIWPCSLTLIAQVNVRSHITLSNDYNRWWSIVIQHSLKFCYIFTPCFASKQFELQYTSGSVHHYWINMCFKFSMRCMLQSMYKFQTYSKYVIEDVKIMI